MMQRNINKATVKSLRTVGRL